MTIKINQMLSLRMEWLLAKGISRQEIVDQLKQGTFAREQQIGEGTMDFSLLIEFAETHWDECEQAILNGYRVTFHTFNGVKSLLAAKFGLQAERDYQDKGDHLDGIPLSAADVESLKSILAVNWRVIEGEHVQIRLAPPQE
ncbi:MAG: hypothetical protein WCC10_04100 [Tumebacillaceae bacterium]